LCLIAAVFTAWIRRSPGALVVLLAVCWVYYRIVSSLLQRKMSRKIAALDYLVCLECGYNLRDLPEHRCPECGTPFVPDEVRAKWTEWSV